LTYTHEKSQDAGHDDNEETDLDQDDYEPESTKDTNAEEDDDEDDDGNLFILLIPYDFLHLFTLCKRLIMRCPCYYTNDQDPKVEIARLHGLIGQKEIEIKELQNRIWFRGGDYSSLY